MITADVKLAPYDIAYCVMLSLVRLVLDQLVCGGRFPTAEFSVHSNFVVLVMVPIAKFAFNFDTHGKKIMAAINWVPRYIVLYVQS